MCLAGACRAARTCGARPREFISPNLCHRGTEKARNELRGSAERSDSPSCGRRSAARPARDPENPPLWATGALGRPRLAPACPLRAIQRPPSAPSDPAAGRPPHQPAPSLRPPALHRTAKRDRARDRAGLSVRSSPARAPSGRSEKGARRSEEGSTGLRGGSARGVGKGGRRPAGLSLRKTLRRRASSTAARAGSAGIAVIAEHDVARERRLQVKKARDRRIPLA